MTKSLSLSLSILAAGSVVFIALMVIEVVVMLLVMLAVWAWWIADLVIFATNQRDAGNGCMLRENL